MQAKAEKSTSIAMEAWRICSLVDYVIAYVLRILMQEL
jgi:hypothetical protein